MANETNSPSNRVAQLRAMLAEQIPVTQPLGIRVLGVDRDHLMLEAPLAANRNHQGTAFAGSVNALATLTGWASVWLRLTEAGVNAFVVIQDSTISYRRPVTADFRATCALPSQEAFDALRDAVERHGRGRITMAVSIMVADDLAAMFEGRYVALSRTDRGRAGKTPPA